MITRAISAHNKLRMCSCRRSSTTTWKAHFSPMLLLKTFPARSSIRLLCFAKGRDMNVAMILEYLPHGKINSVPEDATPYRRNIPGNNLFLIQWEENSPEKQQLARRIAHDLADLMPEGEGYGNYSKLSRLKGCIVYIYSYFRQVASTTLLFIKTGLRPLRRFKCYSANITLSCKESKRNTIQTWCSVDGTLSHPPIEAIYCSHAYWKYIQTSRW